MHETNLCSELRNARGKKVIHPELENYSSTLRDAALSCKIYFYIFMKQRFKEHPMRSVFIGYFRPKDHELLKLWTKSVFVIDANVLLNLYRYSEATRDELEKALTSVKDNIFITHQAAKEFLRNRLSVTAGQAKEYTITTKSIKDLVRTLSSKDRHPFLSDDELPGFEEYSSTLISSLEQQHKKLLDQLSNDEILSYVENLFKNKTGKPYSKEELERIYSEGDVRYQNEIPPGYKDITKDDPNDPSRKFGDLLVWKQTIDYAKKKKKSIIIITDDKKEDWWIEQSGRTIAPRPELIEEFHAETKNNIWIYSVDRFIQESAKISKETVSDDVIKEILKLREELKSIQLEVPLIQTSQNVIESNNNKNIGHLYVQLNSQMPYATGTGKFNPKLDNIPSLEVNLISTPNNDSSNIHLSYGCGVTKNFNVHMKSKTDYLEAGEYVFEYTATSD